MAKKKYQHFNSYRGIGNCIDHKGISDEFNAIIRKISAEDSGCKIKGNAEFTV